MSDYTSKKLAFNNAEQFKESFYEPEPATIGYVFLGNHIGFTNEDVPDSINDTVYDEKTVWDYMFAAKKVTGNDVELVVPKITWTANTQYRQFDDTKELSFLTTANTVTGVQPMYVMNSERNVYLCLCNNVSGTSTVEPTGKNLSSNGIIQLSDGHMWKYLYNIKPTNKFLSNNWIPVPISTSKLDYDTSSIISVDGELTKIITTNGGSGCTILTLSNTNNIVANMSVTGTGIAGGTHVTTVDVVNTKITISTATTASGGGTGNLLNIRTRVYIDGDGDTAIAAAQLTGNAISKTVLTTYGKNYNRANILFFGTGTGATARAVLPPKFGHGYNPAKQLGATNVMISIRIGEVDSTEGGIISTDTTYRQYGLLRDPYKYGQTSQANNSTANSVISQTTDVTLIAGDAYELDEFVYQGSSSNPTFSGYVNNQGLNEVNLTKVKGTIAIGTPLKGTETNPSGRTVVTLTNPEFQPYTGDILFVENLPKIQRTEGQAENLKFVVRF
jgi:hypothetical protein